MQNVIRAPVRRFLTRFGDGIILSLFFGLIFALWWLSPK